MTEHPSFLADERPEERAPLPGFVSVLIAVGAVLLLALLPWSSVFRNQVIDATRSLPGEWRFNRGLGTAGEKLEAFHGFNYRASVFVRGRAGPTDVVLLPPRPYLELFYDPAEIEWTDPRYAVYMAGWFHPVTVTRIAEQARMLTRADDPTAAAPEDLGRAVTRAVVVDVVEDRPALAVIEVMDPDALANVFARYGGPGWGR